MKRSEHAPPQGGSEGNQLLSLCPGPGPLTISTSVAQQLENLPAMQETQGMRVQFLGWEDPLEEEMATHSSILTWKIPWRGEPGGLLSMGSHKNRSQLND